MSRPDDLVVTTETDIDISESADATRAQHTVEQTAAEIGFEDDISSELGLVATELATNLDKHAGGGTLSIKTIAADSQTGIRLESEDSGPGIQDIEAAFTTGSSTAGSLGLGLSIVNQTMDELEVTTPEGPEAGTRLVADRWLIPEYETTKPNPASIGAASRAISTEQVNGDAFIAKTWNDKTLVGVIDGLGHGSRAHKAATTARSYVESHVERPLASIFRGADRACKGTRGVVMALAKFDWREHTLTFANIGNINVKLSGPEWTGLIVRRGVVGGNNPGASVVTREWDPGFTMVLYSDGISTRWDWDDIRDGGDDPAGAIANRLLKQYGKSEDDATALVVTDTND
ncbi:ATP-binding protein [Halorubrum sp. BV1]|uniref:ATP-binding protein n=1 Tax=Halorubrum sp. BV1 TaxID=1498500 RepID=UPI00067960EE|nr:ATP-binding protein [Halorubrum sp. BV1]